MRITTCLLITDDHDDHVAFSEALSEISAQTIVLVALDSVKALALVKSKKFIPDYFFLDLSMPGIKINSFMKVLHADRQLQNAPTVLYGEQRVFNKIENLVGAVFFNKEYEYSELRAFLKDFINGQKQ